MVGLLLLCSPVGCAPRTTTVTTPQATSKPAPVERHEAAPPSDPVCVLGPVEDESLDPESPDEQPASAAGEQPPASDLFGPPPTVAAAPAGQLRRVQGVTTARFGAGRYGFVEWMSADARLVALRTFGRPPRVSHHGESGLKAQLELVDTTTGQREQPDDIVAEDPRGRYIVVRAGKQMWLIDSETGKRDDLAARGADLESDENACLPPRHALFDATGTHVLFIRKGPDRLVQRDLQSGVETEIAAGPGRLWAAISDGPDERPLLIVVPKDSNGDSKITLPRQRTTCACRWCGRFAMMSSSPGFEGDAFKFLVVDGARRVEVASPGMPLGADAFAEGSEGPLTRADGSPYPLPQGCQDPQVVRGSPAVLLTCDTRGGVLWPATGKLAELADPVRPLQNASTLRHDGRRLVGATLGGDEALEAKLYQPHNIEKICAWGGFASVKHVTKYIQPGIELIPAAGPSSPPHRSRLAKQ